MKKIALFSAGGIVLAILIVLLTAGAKSNVTLTESTVSETLVADTTAVTETEKTSEAVEATVVEPTETETTPTVETTDPPKAKEPAAPALTVANKSQLGRATIVNNQKRRINQQQKRSFGSAFAL